MLKKISNWTFGSIFRTIGRFIAYIIIGILISLLFIKKDYVKADTLTNTIWQTYYYDTNKTTPYPTSTSGNWQYESLPSTTNNNWGGYYLYLGTDIVKTNFDYVLIPFNITGYSSISDTTTDLSGVGCIISGSIASDGTYRYNSFICPSNTTYSSQTQSSEVKVSVSLHEKNGDNDSPCTYENGYMKCSVLPNVTYGKMYITYNIPYDLQYATKINFGKAIQFYKDIFNSIESNQQTQIQQQNSTMQVITGEVNGTGENGTITDEDAESSSCGIICKLKHLIKMLSIDNIKYLVIPTEEQMNDLFEQMQTKITSKLGILGLPITVYTRLMQIAMQYDDNQQNWCLTWNNVQVPNFEDFNIIQGGQWCFSDILQNEKINTFRTVCITIIGGLILLAFIQYLFNCLHRILDVPVQDNYEYFTTEDVYGIDTDTGVVQSHTIKSRRTTRRPV